jgi:hypothetical protein
MGQVRWGHRWPSLPRTGADPPLGEVTNATATHSAADRDVAPGAPTQVGHRSACLLATVR